MIEDAALNDKLKSAIADIPQSHDYLIGLSGGLDSLALIYFCLPHLRQFTSSIKAIHVHHGLSEHADEWVQFCAKICRSVDLELVVEHVQIMPGGDGLEAAAREARYKVFSRYMQKGSVLLLGHHLDDQAETLLMRFLKGLGPAALRGISRQRRLSGGMIFRPWLDVPRTILKQELSKITTDWVEDESNSDRRFERNFLRHEILPLLVARRHSVLQDLRNAAARCADYADFVEQWCRQHEGQFLSASYSMEKALDLARLKGFSDLEQKFILRYWFDYLGVHQPGEANFNRILIDLVTPDVVAKAEVVWQDYCVRAFDGALFCFPAHDLNAEGYEYVVPLADLINSGNKSFRLDLPGGTLSIETTTVSSDSGLELNALTYQYDITCFLPAGMDRLVIRSKRPGDRINLNEGFSQTLKKLYQSHRVLPWHREIIPVFLAGSAESINQKANLEASKVDASLAGFVSSKLTVGEVNKGLSLRCRYFTQAGLLKRN